MSTLNTVDAKTIDDLQELGKLNGKEKTIVSNGYDTKKVSIDTIMGYIVSNMNNSVIPMSVNNESLYGQGIIFIPEGEEIPVSQRIPGYFYLEEQRQTSIRTQINIPASITVSGNLGLKRI